MRFKATKKAMRDYDKILGAGYCKMQNLLHYRTPIAYSERACGHACDYYVIERLGGGEVLISTGYSPLKTKNLVEDNAVVNEYESKAHGLRAEERESLLTELLEKLVK